MDNLELLKLMSDTADDAIRIAKEEFDIELDFSAQSISKVDLSLQSFVNIYKDQALEDKAVFTICNLFGAYVGETFRRIHGGAWIYDDADKDAPNVFLSLGNSTFAFAGICYECLVNSSEVSVEDYYNNAIKQSKTH